MRVSIRPQDSGYTTHTRIRAVGKKCGIKFNGEPQYDVITADSEAGMIVRYARDAQGAMTFDTDRQSLVDEVVHGKVEIELFDELTL